MCYLRMFIVILIIVESRGRLVCKKNDILSDVPDNSRIQKFLEREMSSLNYSWMPKITRFYGDYSLVNRIPITPIYKFRTNDDFSLLFYPVPRDVEEVIITFVAFEQKLNTAGGECTAQDVEIHLKPRSFPMVNPTNTTLSADFISNEFRTPVTSVTMKSNEVATVLSVFPEPGELYGSAFVSWTNPKLDPIEQQGLAAECQTLLYSDMKVKIAKASIVDCSKIITLEFEENLPYVNKLFKCFIDHESQDHLLSLSVVSKCTTCVWAIIKIQARSLPRRDVNIIDCAVNLEDTPVKELKINFNPYPKEWHYLEVKYGNTEEIISEASKLNLCKKAEATEAIEAKDLVSQTAYSDVVELIRDKKVQYFSVDFNLPSSSVALRPTMLHLVSGVTDTLKFNIFPVSDIGGTVTMIAQLKTNDSLAPNSHLYKVVICFVQGRQLAPYENEICGSNKEANAASLILNSNGTEGVKRAIHVPYPEFGTWYVSLALFCTTDDTSISFGSTADNEINACNASVELSISSSSCIRGSCGPYGDCNVYIFNGYLVSYCLCKGGYSGFDCSDGENATPPSETLTAILFLTLSNLLFLPSIVISFRRKYYTESLVYLFTMFFSTFYHACDASDKISYGLCIVRMGVLQYCDFFCGLLSFWVTLIAMASLDHRIVSVLHIFGAVMIAFGTEYNKLAIMVFLIPVIIGVTIIAIAWGFRSWKTKSIFPAKVYWIIFLPGGLILVTIGLLCFTIFQTNSNYYIVHSIWHMMVALSVLCLLPTKLYFCPKKNYSKTTVNTTVVEDSSLENDNFHQS